MKTQKDNKMDKGTQMRTMYECFTKMTKWMDEHEDIVNQCLKDCAKELTSRLVDARDLALGDRVDFHAGDELENVIDKINACPEKYLVNIRDIVRGDKGGISSETENK